MTLADKLRQLLAEHPDVSPQEVDDVVYAHALAEVGAAAPPPIVPPPPPPEAPPAVELLDLVEEPGPAQRIAAAMRTGNTSLVAKVRAECGR